MKYLKLLIIIVLILSLTNCYQNSSVEPLEVSNIEKSMNTNDNDNIIKPTQSTVSKDDYPPKIDVMYPPKIDVMYPHPNITTPITLKKGETHKTVSFNASISNIGLRNYYWFYINGEIVEQDYSFRQNLHREFQRNLPVGKYSFKVLVANEWQTSSGWRTLKTTETGYVKIENPKFTAFVANTVGSPRVKWEANFQGGQINIKRLTADYGIEEVYNGVNLPFSDGSWIDYKYTLSSASSNQVRYIVSMTNQEYGDFSLRTIPVNVLN